MTVEKPAYQRDNGRHRKTLPASISKKNERPSTKSRRATTDALDICFDYEPLKEKDGSDASIGNSFNHEGSTDDLQNLLSAIHKRYKLNSEKKERDFKDSIKQTVKRSVHEFQSHMDKFTSTMYSLTVFFLTYNYREDRLSKLRQELNSIYLERQKQLDTIYEEYEEFKVSHTRHLTIMKLAMQESIQKVEEKDTSFRNAVAQYFEDTKSISTFYN
jgi:hypothetical protein